MKKWKEIARQNMTKFNESLTPEQLKEHRSNAGKKRWATMSIEQKADHLRKMRNARK